MTIGKNTRELVEAAADQLHRAGIRPTVMKVRQITGQGSATTIADQLQQWHKRNQAEEKATDSPLPNFLIEANRALLEQAESAAIAQFAEERTGYYEEILSLRSDVEAGDLLRLELLAELSTIRAELVDKSSVLDNVKNELIRFQAENALMIAGIADAQKDAENLRDALAARTTEYAESVKAAETRLRDMEKRMLMEIDKARMDSKDAIAYAHRKANEYDLEVERIRVISMEEKSRLSKSVNELSNENGRLTSAIEGLQALRRKAMSKRLGFRASKMPQITRFHHKK